MLIDFGENPIAVPILTKNRLLSSMLRKHQLNALRCFAPSGKKDLSIDDMAYCATSRQERGGNSLIAASLLEKKIFRLIFRLQICLLNWSIVDFCFFHEVKCLLVLVVLCLMNCHLSYVN